MRSTSDELESRLESLEELVGLVRSAGAPNRILELGAHGARGVLEASTVSLSIWDREIGRWRTLVNVGELGPGEETFPDHEVYALHDFPAEAAAMVAGQAYLIGAGADDPALSSSLELLEGLGKRSALSAAVVLDGVVWGELYATRTHDAAPFDPADLDLATAVASQLGMVIAQAELVAEFQHLAYTDPLTGLANRRAFTQRVDAALSREGASGVVTALLTVDLNGLKQINDERGHEAGDAALQLLARVLTQPTARPADAVVGRIGGDEFCVLLERVTSETVVAIAEDVCERAVRALHAGVACGVATTADLSSSDRSSQALLRLADAAQYRAKHSGAPAPRYASEVRDVGETASPGRDRRAFRGRDDHDVGQILNGVADALAHCQTRDMVKRIACAADHLTTAVVGVSWFVSERFSNSDRILTREGGVIRRPNGVDAASQYPAVDPGFFVLDEFPQTKAALSGRAVHLSVDDPDAHPREIELITGESCTQVLMTGGTTLTGTSYLLEIYGDASTPSLSAFAALAQASVAMALFS